MSKPYTQTIQHILGVWHYLRVGLAVTTIFFIVGTIWSIIYG